MESATSEVSEVPDFIYVAGGQTYVATSQEEVSKIISSYERATIARFVVEHQSTKFGTEDWHGKKLFRWSLKSVPSAFGPAIVIGTKVLCCHQGKDRHLNFKKLKREQTRLKRMSKDQGLKEKDPTASRKTTKKVNCPAAIYIKKVAFFPDYQVTEATPHRKRMACKRFNQDRLKRPESIKVDVKFFVTLPDSKDHRNHLSGDDLFKKIMKNRTLYDPQASIPKKKKKKKSKKRRKREKKLKTAEREREEESLEHMAFSFLPNTSSAGDGLSIPDYRINEQEQLVTVAGQTHDMTGQHVPVAGLNMGVVGPSIHVAGSSMGVAGPSMGVVGQRLDVAGQSTCMGVPGPSMNIAGQRLDVSGHDLGIAGQDEGVMGQDLITVDRRQLLPMEHL